MTDITELHARITAALDRIGSGIDGLGAAGAGGAAATAAAAEIARLTDALDAERTANAQLEERVRTIKERQDGTVEMLAAEVDRLRGLLAAEEGNTARLAKVNAELRANNTALREAIQRGVSEPHLVNKSMMAELEALRAAQAADRTELDAVLGEIARLVDEAARAAGTEEETADA